MKIVKKLKMSFLIISLFLLAGIQQCDGGRPVEHIYVPDVQHNVCSQRRILSFSPLKTEWVQDLPLIECDGAMGIHRNDVKSFTRWIEDLINQAQEFLQKMGYAPEG